MKKLKSLFLILIVITFLLLIYSVLFPNMVLENDTIYYNKEYSIKIKAYNLFTDLTDKVHFTDNVDASKIGKYTVTGKIKYLFFNRKKNFTVSVVDNEKPLISLRGGNKTSVCPGKKYEEEGYTASDNYDKDITDKVKVSYNDDNVLYEVNDSSGNYYKVVRKLIFEDKEKPTIKLNGDKEMYIYVGGYFEDPSYTATDNCDGDITSKVITSGNVDTSTVGTYTIKYEVTDEKGNKSEETRDVKVITRPSSSYYGNGVIYLTFDDGPSNLTGQIINILEEEGVKATFFVTGADVNTKRAYDLGHAIALHSYTHDYSYIYASASNYFEDLQMISDRVYGVIGIRSNIIRFPGGSSNTISRNYSSGIMTYLTSEVVNRGYTYFDWNIDSNDAGSDVYNSTNIYSNVINNLSHGKTNVVLMHDSANHTATVNALRDIIRFGKNNGYSFDAITSNTPVVRHGVNN